MPAQTSAQVTELFHLAFLQVLESRLDNARYVLKGGANLRYFFDSVRYSEDIDLDMNGVEPWKLADAVDRVLESPPLALLLQTAGLGVDRYSKPKQTDTTRRWKVAVRSDRQEDPIHSKIEFSNRNGDDRHLSEPVPARIVEPYALRAPIVQHYTAPAAIEQKVEALALRSESQARDVFDLDLLLRRESLPDSIDDATLKEAAERALGLPFHAFSEQVVPFLRPEIAELYDSPTQWEQMQLGVAEKLGGDR